MDLITALKERVLAGGQLQREEALSLCNVPLEPLCEAADEIRAHFCSNVFDICTIINGKSGRCSEDCKYCAQSAHNQAKVEEYPLLGTAPLLRQAQLDAQRGVLRFCIVASGRALSDREVDSVCESIRTIREEVGIQVCGSFGLLGEAQLRRIKAAGACRIHCNLETSRCFFPTVCTTHTYDEKVETLRAAKRAGLSICSGGIMGLGEGMAERIDLALALRELEARSVPVNFLNPIPGTPFGENPPVSEDEKRRIVAIYRFLLPDASLRLAGGRGLMEDRGEACFASGANAVISGDMLTTSGITVETDMALLDRLGYQVGLWEV